MTQLFAGLSGQSTLIVLAILLTALLIVAMGAVTWSFDLRRSRLPQATAWEDLNQRIIALTGQLSEKQAELQETKRQIQERDQVSAEIAVLTTMRDDLHVQLSGLDEGRRQIEEVQHKAAEAATEYAEASRKLEELRRALAEEEERRAPMVGELERITGQVTAARNELDQLHAEVGPLRTERAEIERGLNALRQEHTTLQVSINEAQDLIGQIGMLRQEVEELQRQKEQVQSLAVDAERHRSESAYQLDTLRLQLAEAERLVSRLPELEGRKAALEEVINERKAALEEMKRQAGGQEGGRSDERSVGSVGDLRLMPSCLSDLPGPDRATETEAEAVAQVCSRLEQLGLRYSRRTVKAFHTALKIGDTTQMTVLAGVSGTGKSLLPRRYAEAMGIGFLQIAVEPRWDSTQDLLGFYNYVEKRYRATELARALVQMDPYNTSGLAKQPLDDRMLLVLLDEMNLARVEYYFSEFLSRLEVRPPYAEASNEAKRRDASMPIDIRGHEEGPVYLFPSHNVLFVGTMNDDESTQALSDKVLDRSNVMQFAAPDNFAGDHPPAHPRPPAGYRRFKEWRNWVKTTKNLHDADRARVGEVIRRLARIMDDFGRPFGHRLNEAILTYVANYPLDSSQSPNEPMADQIEFRILPKLRGVSIDETRTEFGKLAEVIVDELGDRDFAGRLTEIVERQGRASGQFNWRGLDRV